MSSEGVFTVSGLDFPDGIDPLGIWQTLVFKPASFAIGPTVDDEVSVWRIQLPDDQMVADAIIQSQIELVTEQQSYLEEILTKLETLNLETATPTSYTIGAFDPQTVLLNSINALRQPATVFSHDDTVDYGLLYARCEMLVNRFRDIISRRGRVETRIGDNLVGLTKIDWTGDFETIWEGSASNLAQNVHVKAVHLTSSTRLAVLRILTIVGTGALSLTIKASIPGGQFLLIPAVYKFIRDMLGEFKKLPQEMDV